MHERKPDPSLGSMIRAIVLAGVASGVGKTTVTLALLEALGRRGLRVQPFKVGPDFIDPGLHARVAGRPSWTLDGWMCDREHVVGTVARKAADADLALVEGVMGCFDGVDGTTGAGSTAEVARWLGAPVVLVVDAGALAASAGAVVLGFERFDPGLHLAGVIFNRVAGPTHYGWLREAVEHACRAAPLGWLPARPSLALPERHLGLVTAPEGFPTREWLREAARCLEESVDVPRLLALARSAVAPALPGERAAPVARIGVARDEAFQFYYPANLEGLVAAGAALVSWSPLEDAALPEVDGLYLGGGYPELHAARLAANERMLEAVRAFAESGRPVYAECGGLMYLAEAIEDEAGACHPMVGLLPTTVRMRPKRLALDYARVETTLPTPLGPAGSRFRGHEFHASWIEPVPERIPRAYRVQTPRGEAPRAEGYLVGNALVSYFHLHFGSNPAAARQFVGACRRTAQ
jgi:cobyrinic acid a,c-diamide synthase